MPSYVGARLMPGRDHSQMIVDCPKYIRRLVGLKSLSLW